MMASRKLAAQAKHVGAENYADAGFGRLDFVPERNPAHNHLIGTVRDGLADHWADMLGVAYGAVNVRRVAKTTNSGPH